MAKAKETVHQKGARKFREIGHDIRFLTIRNADTANERYVYAVPSDSHPGHYHEVCIYTQIDGETCRCEAYTLCWHIICVTLLHAKTGGDNGADN